MCPGTTVTRASTPVAMSTQPAGSYCLCCFSQVVRHLWSLDVSGIHRHMTSTLVGTSILQAGSFCLCCFWQVVRHLWSCTCPGSPVTCTSTLIGMSTWPAGSFCLCCFWQVVRHLRSLQVSGICHHTDLHPGRNVYLTSWFILSGCFLTGGKTSVVPTCVWDLPSHGCPPQ